VVVAIAIAAPVFALVIGDVETFLTLPSGQHPEGVAFDRDGNLYFGNRFAVAGGGFDSELRKITPDGKNDTVIATFAHSPGSALLGLVTDDDGDVWAAVHGGADHGVWRVSGNGKNKVRIDGSAQINFPNALTFDARGNLYVTDSGPVVPPVGGAIWRLAKGASSFELWSNDVALAPLPIDPIGFPLPGANGIAFFPSDSLYVANTEKGQVFRMPILADGSAGVAEAVTVFFAVPTVDGIAMDVHGNIHAVLPGHAVLGAPPLVQVDPDTGVPTRTTSPAFDGLFDIPLSLAFDTLPGERTSLFVTNGDLTVAPIPIGQGPRLLRANVGVKGSRGK
jgi:sugar lactone lactonase YvrE